jgi:DNA helicase-2/ATP-dependent DNA helicase PcrA
VKRLDIDDLSALFGLTFTDEQLAAITAPHGPAVVIAGAGSGKTTLMSARVVWLVGTGQVQPDQVLGLTFTNKAAAELSTRIRRALRMLEQAGATGLLEDGEPTVSTYHAYAAGLIREHGVWLGYEPGAQLLTEPARVQLAEQVARRAAGPFPALGLGLTPLTERLVTLEGELNEHLVRLDDLVATDQALVDELDQLEREQGKLTADPAKARAAARGRLELAPLVAEFRAEKARRERVDFGDQMAAAAHLAEQVGDVVEVERGRFTTVLLDEYQDTSMAQQRLLVALFGAGHPVMAVGDPFQSIYGWRGASVRNIVSFADDFAGPEATPVFALSQNNRSGGRILAAANTLAAPLRAQLGDVAELRPRLGEESSGTVHVALHATAADELDALCDAVAAEVADGQDPQSIAILCRESKVFPEIIAGLTARDVPVDVVGLSGLLELPEVAEVVSVLEVLHDPTANPSLVRLLAGPRWRIGAHDLALLGARARELAVPTRAGEAAPRTLESELAAAVADTDPAETLSLVEALDDPGDRPYSGDARVRFGALARELRSLRSVLHQPPDRAVATVVATTGIDVELAVHGRSGEHLDALVAEARAFATGGGSTVGAFLAYLGLARRYRTALPLPTPTSSGGVALLTVHKSKGLEWSSVYVPQVAVGVFPNSQSRSTPWTSPGVLPYSLRGDAADFPVVTSWAGNKGVKAARDAVSERDLAEDRRLAYVAVTRAAERLVVSGHRWGPSQSRPRAVSPYLAELADFCRSGSGELLCWADEPGDGAANPALAEVRRYAWPQTGDLAAAARRRVAADQVRAAMRSPTIPLVEPALAGQPDEAIEARVKRWDADLEALLMEARRSPGDQLAIPDTVSASWTVALLRDGDAALRRLLRPLPRPPAPAAHRGTRFHEWVESLFGQVPLIDAEGLVPDDVPDVDRDLDELREAFLAGPYADRRPVAVEAPFQLVLGDRGVAGRIDAVYRIDPGEAERHGLDPHIKYEVVDWKTGRASADPLQLALYRVAWAELHHVDVREVAATFYYVATGERARPADLPDRAALTEWWARVTT